IATLKVLGYNMREVAGYVFREIFLLVILGVLVGFGLGFGLLYFIISSINSANLVFPVVIEWWTFLVGAGITILFSLLVDLILLPKLKKIDMADSMKAVD
ncbi:MAG: FtsX-like permease family protein, partial [Clostridia bacterium]|nr:FtsX-like permease family protein [Clostridia bacterium]